ncbi:glycosyltransferase [Candidatus Saccharibacteria bacterium]|nr:glycosyltransferase [Candidatus Saccharibacteria bacterium]
MADQESLKVSIIVPAYNIAEYLPACLDSILAQDFEDFEIIIIDDGSTDQTPKIADEYEEKFDKISTIHQKNAGLSAARNTGIKKAKGKYLAFIDGDDLIAKSFLRALYGAIESTSSDLAVCELIEFSNQIPDEKAVSSPEVKTREEAVSGLLVGQENRDIIVCNKLFKKELFENIKFPVGELHEDNLTTYKLFAETNSVAYIKDRLYYYRKRPGSIMAEQDLLARLKIKERAAKEAISYFKNDPALKSAAEISLLLVKFAYLDNIASGKIHNKELWQETIKEINASRKFYKTNPYLTKKLKLYLALLKTPISYKTFRKIFHE